MYKLLLLKLCWFFFAVKHYIIVIRRSFLVFAHKLEQSLVCLLIWVRHALHFAPRARKHAPSRRSLSTLISCKVGADSFKESPAATTTVRRRVFSLLVGISVTKIKLCFTHARGRVGPAGGISLAVHCQTDAPVEGKHSQQHRGHVIQ